MPLTRYQIRNEYSLADPELYTAADKDDAEAVLEGVAMAGLVGVLRQLGDLAEFAAGLFHDLHEEVLATAARGHDLKVRVQQLEAEVPSVEKALLSQTNHASFFTHQGEEWHPNLRTEQNLITSGDLPRCVMDSYEESRAPPPLFQLDKYDVAGAGACLKRYTDPSFVKVETTSSNVPTVEFQREKKNRKIKKKGSHWRTGDTPEVVPTSHAKLHQLFLEERIENAYSDPARRVNLKRRQLNASPMDSNSGKSYMEKFLETPSPEHKMVFETPASDHSSPFGLEIVEINTVSPLKKPSQENKCTELVKVEDLFLKHSKEESHEDAICKEIVKVPESIADGCTGEIPPDHHYALAVYKEDVDHSEDLASEADNYVDALMTLESEKETDNEVRREKDPRFLSVRRIRMHTNANKEQLEFRARSPGCQSYGVSSSSDDGNNSYKGGRSNLSYSDTISNLTEDPPSDNEGAANTFLSIGYHPSAAVEPSIQPPALAWKGPKSNEVASPKDTFLNEERVCEDGKESNSHPIDLHPTSTPLDARQSSVVASPVEHGYDEISSCGSKHDSELSNSDENGTNLCYSSEAVSCDPNEIQDDSPITDSSEKNHADGLHSENVNASSNGLLHLSKISQLAAENESNRFSLNGAIQTDNDEENDAENPSFIVSSEKGLVDGLGLGSGNVNASSNGLLHLSNIIKLDSDDETNGDSLNEVIQTENEENGSENPPFTVSSEKSHVDGLDRVNEDVYSNGLMHLSHNSQLASQKGISSDSLDEVVLADNEESVEEISADQIVSSPKSIISPSEKQLICPTLPESENHSGTTSLSDSIDDMKHGNLASENCDTVSDIGSNSDGRSLLMEYLPIQSFDDKQMLSCDPSQVKTDTRKIEASFPEQNAYLDEVSVAAETEENASPLDLDSDLKSETEIVSVQAEDVAVPSAAAPVSLCSDVVDYSVCESSSPICSNSGNQMSLDQSLSATPIPHQEGSDINGALSEGYLTETKTQKEEKAVFVNNEAVIYEDHIQSVVQNEINQAVGGPTDSDSTPSVSYNCSTEGDMFHSSVAEQTERSSSFHHEIAPDVSSELTNQESGLRCLHESNFAENAEEVISASTSHLSGPGISLEQSDVQAEQTMGNGQLEGENLGPLHVPPSQTEPELDQESHLRASAVQREEDSCSQPLKMELLPPLALNELEIGKHDMEPDVSTSGQFSEATQVSMEEMPPLPPLPPMQWRMGKGQHSSITSHGEFLGQGSFSVLPQYLPEQNPQFSIPATQGGVFQYGSSVSNFSHVDEEKSRLMSGQVVANVVQPTLLMNLTPTVTNTNNQYWGISSNGSGFMNPFFMLPAAFNERPVYGFDAMNGKWAISNGQLLAPVPAIESSISSVNSVSSHETPSSPQSQFVLDGSSEKEEPQQSTRNSEEEYGGPTSLAKPPSSEMHDAVEDKPLSNSVEEQQHKNVEEQPQQCPTASEGEVVQTSNAIPLPGLSTPEGFWSSNALSLSLPAEVGKVNGNPSVKAPRPRNPLIDAVAAHDKSKLRKVSELPQNEPKSKVDERNSLLEQIRKKSVNLKPAVVTRPSTQGPKTNLKVAAILEKANAIRQACAGSDDDDEDSWSE